MKNKTLLIGLVASASLCCGAAGAAELLVTGGSSKAGNTSMISVDFVSEGDSRGLQARIALPKGVKADTSNCLKSLPQGFQGICEFNQGEVRLMAFAFDDRKLPAGLLELGVIKVSGQVRGESGLNVVDFQSVDSAGKPLPSKATVSFGAPSTRAPAPEQQR